MLSFLIFNKQNSMKNSPYKTIVRKTTILLFIILTATLNAQIPRPQKQEPDIVDKHKETFKDSVNEMNYVELEKMPIFPGGEGELLRYIEENIRYPEDAKINKTQGKVIVRFKITKTGKIENIEIIRGLSKSLDNESLRIVNTFPDFIPGEESWSSNGHNWKKVDTYYTLPITFKLKDDSKHLVDNQSKNILPLSIDSIKVNEQKIYTVIEQMPVFPGGDNALINFVSRNIKYPVEAFQNKEQGKVVVRFVVNTEGKVEKAQVIRSVSPSVDKEALRVINILPAFTPGKQNGKVVKVYFTLPITFKLETWGKSNLLENWADPKIGTRGKSNYHSTY
jgi:TonB family protein